MDFRYFYSTKRPTYDESSVKLSNIFMKPTKLNPRKTK